MGSDAAKAEALYGRQFSAYASWKASRKDGDSAQEYWLHSFVVQRLKILNEATFGEAVFVSAVVIRT